MSVSGPKDLHRIKNTYVDSDDDDEDEDDDDDDDGGYEEARVRVSFPATLQRGQPIKTLGVTLQSETTRIERS